MSIEVVAPPAVEPVSAAEIKSRLKIEHAEDDDLIAALIAAARERAEAHAGRALVTRRVRELRDDWEQGGRLSACGRQFRLGLGPVTAVHHVKTYADDDSAKTFDAANYFLDAATYPARIAVRGGALWPVPGRTAAGVEIEYDAGFGAAPAAVPFVLREAVALLVADAYEHRAPADRTHEVALPLAVQGLLAPYARSRL